MPPPSQPDPIASLLGPSPSALERVAWLRAAVDDCHGDLVQARERHASGAVAALWGRLQALRIELDAACTASDEDELPEDEFLSRLESAAQGMPDQHLEVFVGAYCERYRLHLVDEQGAPVTYGDRPRLIAS